MSDSEAYHVSVNLAERGWAVGDAGAVGSARYEGTVPVLGRLEYTELGRELISASPSGTSKYEPRCCDDDDDVAGGADMRFKFKSDALAAELRLLGVIWYCRLGRSMRESRVPMEVCEPCRVCMKGIDGGRDRSS
jgi:hypothetical protein